MKAAPLFISLIYYIIIQYKILILIQFMANGLFNQVHTKLSDHRPIDKLFYILSINKSII